MSPGIGVGQEGLCNWQSLQSKVYPASRNSDISDARKCFLVSTHNKLSSTEIQYELTSSTLFKKGTVNLLDKFGNVRKTYPLNKAWGTVGMKSSKIRYDLISLHSPCLHCRQSSLCCFSLTVIGILYGYWDKVVKEEQCKWCGRVFSLSPTPVSHPIPEEHKKITQLQPCSSLGSGSYFHSE